MSGNEKAGRGISASRLHFASFETRYSLLFW